MIDVEVERVRFEAFLNEADVVHPFTLLRETDDPERDYVLDTIECAWIAWVAAKRQAAFLAGTIPAEPDKARHVVPLDDGN